MEEDRIRFSIDGDLGTIDGFKLVFPEKVFEKKRDFWMKKGSIGVIAKMATNKANINPPIFLGKKLDIPIKIIIKITLKVYRVNLFILLPIIC